MDPRALALVLLAGLIHAIWNLAAKRIQGGVGMITCSSIAVALLWSPVGVPVLLKESGSWSMKQWSMIVASAALHVIYFVVLLRGYAVGDLSVVYPVARGTGPFITVFISIIAFHEKARVWKLVGVLSIIAGVVLIATGGHVTRSRRFAAGLWFGVFTGVTIAAYTLLDTYSVKRLHISPIGLDYGSNLFRIGFAAPFALASQGQQRLKNYTRVHAKGLLAIGLLSPASYILVLQAAKWAEVSRIAPAREVSIMFGALFAGAFLHEEGARVRLLGAAAIATGVVAIALA